MVDHNDISEKNGDGEEIYYAERLEGDASLAGPETICLVKEDGKSADLFRIPAGCNEEHSVGECIGAGEQLAEMLELDLRIPGVAVVTTAYIRNGMDSVVGSFCRGTDDEKWLACRLAEETGADFVKTSTGFSVTGATVADVILMRQTVSPKVGVKASGGIKTSEDAMKMIDAGANRIGTSSGVAIVTAELELQKTK